MSGNEIKNVDKEKSKLGEFIIGDNKLACFVAEHLLDDTLKYNPIYFWGPTASGKTLLLRTLAEKMRLRYPEKNIIYYNSDAYVNEFTNALRNNDYHTLYLWKRKNSRADILFFDDFEFLTAGKKKASLQAFFQMFNELHLQQKQIIIASNQRPKDIALAEGYKSRLLMGLACEMYCPDERTREEILKRKCEKQKIQLKPEIIEYVAHTIENAGTLAGALNRLAALEEGERKNLTLAQVKASLTDFIPEESPITIEDILDVVAEYFDVTSQELVGKKRVHHIVLARQVAIYVIKNVLTDLTYSEIARAFQRNHASIFYAINKVETELKLEENAHMKEAISVILDRIEKRC